jgi:hypothetical protein
VINKSAGGTHVLNPQSIGSLKIQVFPNPNDGVFTVNFFLDKKCEVNLFVHNSNGKLVSKQTFNDFKPGNQSVVPLMNDKILDGIYFVTIETAYEKATQKIVIKP